MRWEWQTWPERRHYLIVKTRDLLPYDKEILRLSPPIAVYIILSPYWAHRGVCEI